MLKKIAAFAFAFVFAAALSPVRPAAAWDEICVHMPWGTWYSGKFHVVHDFFTFSGELPGSYQDSSGRHYNGLPKELGGSYRVRAQGFLSSPSLSVGRSACVSARDIPDGQAFFVYIQADIGAAALCSTHHTNPNQWYLQQRRPFRQIWWQVGGGVRNPHCNYWMETN